MPQETRDAILTATIRLFNQYGPMVPMAKISEEAGVAAGTPFRYYRTKEDLLHAAYLYARGTALRVLPLTDPDALHGEALIKDIVRHILRWSCLFPQEHQYVCKYEDAVCYDCFSERFARELYGGIIEELGVGESLQAYLRDDLPLALVSRMISVNCAVYARYMQHMHFTADTPEFDIFVSASADSLWQSIRRISTASFQNSCDI